MTLLWTIEILLCLLCVGLQAYLNVECRWNEFVRCEENV